ncbi:glycosyltransferase family 2 protein [Candidatus Microthrix sp.]|jgi:N-acetylglucosaminyl-diphospho-decaprenol L-rhamnosyltransferase|uniref:glycosyltransferase family 2 protein n=1 Tax=Candidatus Neomicrothrix sp. TaxID=2719034 RepID=UPI001B6C2E64|nr:glycosyltransferase family 2 protein [Candidatus Microthrix sp.]MBK7018667.1 glycosyltransferase family 2 protein [Candidatus Microthrix sp.]MBP6133588.1 glycosyltransferase family 2 protein [Candidatus Microthrix sp.]MBP6148555.1 glycosyltransferase family 2 protein [Candidatus Microthrix sp.]MBP7985957.1 glycosyltransferase family 2 protein [Candidatus Microthrix sp.]MBP7993082.1 glycosyltransferase family 2 protein [Candidatus Microthrix sp.]
MTALSQRGTALEPFAVAEPIVDPGGPAARPFDVTTVIVNWNTVDLLDDCLASVAAEIPDGFTHQVVVVDNGSRDGSAEWLRTRHPDVTLIESPVNLGFCRANNLALRSSSSKFVLLINTDARLTPGSFQAMLDRLSDDPRAAIVGPRLVYGDGTFQRWTAGAPIGLRSMATYLFGLDRLGGRSLARQGLYLGRDTSESFQPGWVSSAVMLIRREALDEFGLLNDSIFVYMDDVDLCHRARAANWHVWYAADATAVHLMGASTKRVTGKASPEALRALNRWFVQTHGADRGRSLRALEVAGFGARIAAYGAVAAARRVQPRSSGRARSAQARAQAAAHLAHLKLALEAIDVAD